MTGVQEQLLYVLNAFFSSAADYRVNDKELKTITADMNHTDYFLSTAARIMKSRLMAPSFVKRQDSMYRMVTTHLQSFIDSTTESTSPKKPSILFYTAAMYQYYLLHPHKKTAVFPPSTEAFRELARVIFAYKSRVEGTKELERHFRQQPPYKFSWIAFQHLIESKLGVHVQIQRPVRTKPNIADELDRLGIRPSNVVIDVDSGVEDDASSDDEKSPSSLRGSIARRFGIGRRHPSEHETVEINPEDESQSRSGRWWRRMKINQKSISIEVIKEVD